jgi:hypothetical protein
MGLPRARGCTRAPGRDRGKKSPYGGLRPRPGGMVSAVAAADGRFCRFAGYIQTRAGLRGRAAADPSTGDTGIGIAPTGPAGTGNAVLGAARPGPPGLSGVLLHATALSASAAESTKARACRKGCSLG